MPHCVALGCGAHSKSKDGGGLTYGGDLTYHSFPASDTRRRQWTEACGRAELPKYPRLCSQHFSADSFEDAERRQLMVELMGVRGYRRVLKPDATPTIFLPHRKAKRRRTPSVHRGRKRPGKEPQDGEPNPAAEAAEEAADCFQPDDHAAAILEMMT